MASPSHCVPASSSRYDVFLSFRGEDVRKTFVDHLYYALLQLGICTYKDDQTLPRGESLGPSLLQAIEKSKISVIIFSKNYADSSWCLDELVHIMKCRDEMGRVVYPVFYHVDPSEVRNQKGDFGNGFAKQELKNITKTQTWKNALVDASKISGWELKHMANGHESLGVKEIVTKISDKVFDLMPHADKDLVGMRIRLHSLKSELKSASDSVLMVGIWGIAGGGKTTLAFSLYSEICEQFDGHCIVDNICQESSKHGLKSLQEKILSKVLKTKMEVDNIEEGKCKIQDRLCGSKVLILLDDVDDLNQLKALSGLHKWFGEGSRIIITTRNEHLLIAHNVDVVFPVILLSQDEATKLFNRHAYNKSRPVEDYDELSQRVVSYAGGLPLALKVLGSFLCGRDKNEWMSTLARLEDNPDMKIMEQLKISYDGLQPLEQKIFLDIACFFRGYKKDEVMEVLDACCFHPHIGVKVLREKALISIVDDKFDMHDLVQEMGHYIVRNEHHSNPGKHSRVWKQAELNDMCLGDVLTANNKTETLIYDGCSSRFPELLSRMKKLRLLRVSDFGEGKRSFFFEAKTFVSNELRYIDISGNIPLRLKENFHPDKLVVLKLKSGLQKELWKGYKLLPHLKKLDLFNMKNLLRTPDLDGLSCLERLTLWYCPVLKEIHPSLGNHTSLVHVTIYYCPNLREFPAIVRMGNLRTLEIRLCLALRRFPEIRENMDSLIELSLCEVGVEVLPSSIGEYCTNLIEITVEECLDFKSIEGNFHALKHLRKFKFTDQPQVEKLPKDLFGENCCLEELNVHHIGTRVLALAFPHLPRSLKQLHVVNCNLREGEILSNIGELSNLQELDLSVNDFTRLVFSLSQFTCLKRLDLTWCNNLVRLPELPSSIVVLKANLCKSLQEVGDFHTNCKWLCDVSIVGGRRSLTGGDRLLQSMLEGNAIENRSMCLRLEGVEILKLFQPSVVDGTQCRLHLPDNWYNNFSGFLMCIAFQYDYYSTSDIKITMKHEIGESASIASQHDEVVWEEIDKKSTWVMYVSFGSLINSTWWDKTSSAVSFSIDHPSNDLKIRIFKIGQLCEAFGVRLVPRKIHVEATNSFDHYKQIFKIYNDSNHNLKIGFSGLIDHSVDK